MIIYYLTHIISWIICKIFFRLEVKGIENIPKQGSVLLVSNHVSNMDPIFIPTAVWRRIFNFMAKEELFSNPIIAAYFRKIKMFPIKRGKGDLKAIKTSIDILNRGELLLMFPEGTRSKTGELLPAQPGSALIALKSNATIVPAFISGSEKVLPKGAKMIRLKKITVYFGKSFNLEKYKNAIDSKENYKIIGEEIMKRIAELKDGIAHGS
ncbi:MAG: 1-acyl-sn-glycerol-3-phosphate acyltransferase [Candidatus Firestonebacteria bacterium]|nr:1-acyl-sn-glycerol-3-phosphate acyltransferase [Candidatus Firestonebacteria bacterium]